MKSTMVIQTRLQRYVDSRFSPVILSINGLLKTEISETQIAVIDHGRDRTEVFVYHTDDVAATVKEMNRIAEEYEKLELETQLYSLDHKRIGVLVFGPKGQGTMIGVRAH